MTFKIKKIRSKRRLELKRTAKAVVKRYLKQSKKHIRFKNIMMCVGITILVLFAILVYQLTLFLKEFSFKDVVLSIFHRSVETDSAGHTNFLLVGHGGGNHDGANLTDSMMITSVDLDKKTVSILSIPRDLWIETKELGGARVNKIIELALDEGFTEVEGIKMLEDALEQLLNLEIHYYASIDFSGFSEVIDAIGGVTVDVSETLYDPFYPKDGTYDFEPFYIKAGSQHLDGAKALKYVRSRKTTSDFDRARRQQQVLNAVKEKLRSSETLFSKAKLKKLYDIFNQYVKTDLEPYEFVYLGGQAVNFKDGSIAHSVINDDPYSTGGFLYTPERQYFGGAFVLIPYTNNYVELQRFANFTLYHPHFLEEKTPLHILNGTKTPNLASDGVAFIERYGFDAVRFGNSDEKTATTQIYYRNQTAAQSETLKLLEGLLDSEAKDATNTLYSVDTFSTQADIVIILGDDFAQFKQNNPKFFY